MLLGLLRKVAKYRRSVRHTKHTKQLLHTKQLVFCVTAFFLGATVTSECVIAQRATVTSVTSPLINNVIIGIQVVINN